MNAGAAIRLQKQSWKAKNIRSAVLEVLHDPSYTASAEALAKTLNAKRETGPQNKTR